MPQLRDPLEVQRAAPFRAGVPALPYRQVALRVAVLCCYADEGEGVSQTNKTYLLNLVDALYGGRPRDDTLPDRLRMIAWVLDRVDDATDNYCRESGADHNVDRAFQADIREAANILEGAA